MEKKPEALFPRIQDLFLTRLIILYLQPCEIFATLSNLSRGARALANDCSVWRSIIYGKEAHRLSYDCEDYFAHFLKTLRRPQQLSTLDFHYFFRGLALPKPVLTQLKRFSNLQDLRFGESELSDSNLDLLVKLKFPQLLHCTVPLLSKPDTAQKFINILQSIAPNVSSLTFQDPTYEGPSCTERVSQLLAKLDHLTKLRFKLHQQSSAHSSLGLVTHLAPRLTSIYIKNIVPENDDHKALLAQFLAASKQLIILKLRCKGQILPYTIDWEINTLEEVFISRLTSHYSSLTAFLERNTELSKLVQKHPTIVDTPHPPAPYSLSNLCLLEHLDLGGQFATLSLQNLPKLTYLAVKCKQIRIKLKSWSHRRLNLSILKAELKNSRFQDLELALDFDAAQSVTIRNCSCAFQQKFNTAFSLDTSELSILQRHYGLESLQVLHFIYPAQVPLYIEELLEILNEKLPNLASLAINALFVKQKSLGQVTLALPNITSCTLRGFDKADSEIIVSEACKKLKDFNLLATLEKKVVIEAPQIARIKVEGLKKYRDLIITPMTGYLLHLCNSSVHLEHCPGMGKLIIQYNWSGEKERLTASSEPNFYRNLQVISCRNIQQYSNKFFHAFASSAPELTELYIRFAECLRLEDGTDLEIKHPRLKWVTLLQGEEFFGRLRIGRECGSLSLVKFRDFELKDFQNEAGARFWSEKNLLNEEDF